MRQWVVLGAVLFLTACATGPARDSSQVARASAYEQRSNQLGQWQGWGLTARLSIDDGSDGGSGRLDWSATADIDKLQFRGALGQGAWQLEIHENSAILSLADGSVRTADTVKELVMQELGWPVPVEALRWWVRGLEVPGQDAERSLGETGLLEQLQQSGWTIEYQRYSEVESLMLPSRMQASQGDTRVKLAVSRWWFPTGNDDS